MNDLTIMPSPQEFQTMKELGRMAVQSGFLPTTIKTPEQAIVIMLKGRELGIPPMQAFSQIAVVNGKPTMSSELMLAMIYQRVPGANVDFIHTDAQKCIIEACRPKGKPARFEFNMDDAKKAGLASKGPWISYPTAMLRARCISAMARAIFPDALAGVSYTAEELGQEPEGKTEVIVPSVSNASTEPSCLLPVGASLEQEEKIPSSLSTPPVSEIKPVPVSHSFVSEAQVRLLIIRAKESGWTDEKLKEYMKYAYGLDSKKQLNKKQFDQLLNLIPLGYEKCMDQLQESVK